MEAASGNIATVWSWDTYLRSKLIPAVLPRFLRYHQSLSTSKDAIHVEHDWLPSPLLVEGAQQHRGLCFSRRLLEGSLQTQAEHFPALSLAHADRYLLPSLLFDLPYVIVVPDSFFFSSKGSASFLWGWSGSWLFCCSSWPPELCGWNVCCTLDA